MAYTQANRLIAINTPLGKDALLLRGVTGQEGISQLYHFQLDLLSTDPEINFKDIIGHNVTVRVALGNAQERFFNGIINRFVQVGNDTRLASYQATMVPWLWFLRRTTDCRIFQNKSIPGIIEQVFKDLGYSDYKLQLKGTFEPLDYCVQYRESDFNFVSRLMEQHGIFYFFEHEKDKHILVLANDFSSHVPCPEQHQAKWDPQEGSAVLEEDVITDLQMEQIFRSGKYALTDYNYETPAVSLATEVQSDVKLKDMAKYEVYDFPGNYTKKDHGEKLAKIRIEEEEAQNQKVTGNSSCRAFTSGYRFKLQNYTREKLNQEYVLTEVHHTASVGDTYTTGAAGANEDYSNMFICIPHTVPFRPRRVTPRPVVQGPQTAVVVGKKGEEIWVDKHARVKVQFHWDREGKLDENSSCWVRVSQVHAGKGFGAIDIPRIGEEVVVGFLEGDPDQPIIIGRVYNAQNAPPNGLPKSGMVAGLKSNTTPGGGGSNAVMLDDTKGKEGLTIHAQYDMNTTVEHDANITIVTGKSTFSVNAGTHTETVKGAVKETFQDTHDSTVTNAISITSETASIYIHGSTNIQLHVGASKLWMASDGNISLDGVNVTIQGSSSVTIKGGVVHSEADSEHQTKGAIVLSDGSATNTVKGGMVMLNP